MPKRTLPRHRGGTGWSHPYATGPFDPYLYADGGDDDDSGSSSDDDGDDDASDEDGDDDGDDDGTDDKAKPKPKLRPGRKDDSSDRISRLEKDLADARKEATKSRTDAKKQAAADAEKALATKVAKALGLVEDEDDTETDPAKLMEQLKTSRGEATAAQEEAISARVEATVLRTAYALGVDGDKLLDSRAFCDEIDELDISDPKKFKAALKSSIEGAAKKNAALRLGSKPGSRSGGDLPGGPPEGNRRQRSGLSGAIRGHYGT